MTFRRAQTLPASADGRLRNFFQHAVLSGSDPEKLFVWLEVNIRRTAFDGIEQNLVDESNDRRVFDFIASDGIRFVLDAARYVQVLEIEVVVVER